jgi:hypothetical protein
VNLAVLLDAEDAVAVAVPRAPDGQHAMLLVGRRAGGHQEALILTDAQRPARSVVRGQQMIGRITQRHRALAEVGSMPGAEQIARGETAHGAPADLTARLD